MKIIIPFIRLPVLTALVLAHCVASTLAQEVSIPDPDLNAAIREALQKPNGPLTAPDLLNLTALNACCRNVRSVKGLEAARNLTVLTLQFNHITNFTLPAGLTKLNVLDLSFNPLAHCSLPVGLTNLATLIMESDGLTNFALPAGLTHLLSLDLVSNQLIKLTLPPDITQLNALFVDDNPLATLVLSEPLAATNLAGTVASLQNQGVSVFTYPLAVQLVRPLALEGAFKFGITGPPGVYAVLGSTDLAVWNVLRTVNNPLGSVNFIEATSNLFSQRFYRVLLQNPPANMVFIPPNTFMKGSPTNEQDSNINEGPQTTVTYPDLADRPASSILKPETAIYD